VDRDFVRERYGDVIDFGPCLVGETLNLLCLRGFGRLDELASISAPDVYDMVDNPNGTQRALKRKHAAECVEYAMESQALPPEEDPRFFPEILLNARDANIIEIYNLADPAQLWEFDSFSDLPEIENSFVGLRVNVTEMEYPQRRKSPQISRVDGNHRLHGIDQALRVMADEENEDSDNVERDHDFPPAAFSMLLRLDPLQEAKLFRDINGEHEGMEVAHLDTIQIRTTEAEVLRTHPQHRALWLASELIKPGRAFENKVFMGGAREGAKKLGLAPPIRINSLKSTLQLQLRSSPRVAAQFKDEPEVLLRIVDNFWKAVAKTFPEAWNNKRDFILLQAIGLGAFAKFGGALLDKCFEEEAVDEADFERYLAPVANSVSLARSEYPGIAGAGGQQLVADRLLNALKSDEVKGAKIKEKLNIESPGVDEKLGMSSPESGTSG
jgi:DGQHR domain-containing protein